MPAVSTRYQYLSVQNAGNFDGLTTTTGLIDLVAGTGGASVQGSPADRRVRIVDLYFGTDVNSTYEIRLGENFIGGSDALIWNQTGAIPGPNPPYRPDTGGAVLAPHIDLGNGANRLLRVVTTGAATVVNMRAVIELAWF